MDTLPQDCMRLIATLLARTDGKYRRLCDVASDLASLALVGAPAFTALGVAVQDVLEPHCRERALAEFEEVRLPEWLRGESKLEEMKAVCRERGIPVTGPKAVLWARLRAEAPTTPPRSCFLSTRLRAEALKERTRRVTSSTAKTEYMLDDKDLTQLEYQLAPNPVYRSAAPMRLYLLQDVIAAALKKHGGRDEEVRRERVEEAARRVEAAESRRASRAQLLAKRLAELGLADAARVTDFSEALEKMESTYVRSGTGGALAVAKEIKAAHDRMVELERALAERGCELRDDSRLCRAYIEHGEGDPEEIADTMREMQFFFDHTNYVEHQDAIWGEIRRQRYEEDYDEYVDPDEVSSDAKSAALKDWVKTHDPVTAPELPETLRGQACNMKARVIVEARIDEWRRSLPLYVIPATIRTQIEKAARERASGVFTSNELAELQGDLPPILRSMTERVEAVRAARERAASWGADAPDMFRTETDLLAATKEKYDELVAARDEGRRRAMERDAHKRERQRSINNGICPVCNRVLSGRRGVMDHMRAVHRS